MKSNPDINDLMNINSLFREALKFYADEISYNETQIVNNEMVSKIEIDRGYQARFAIEQAEKITSYREDIISELEKFINNNENNIKDIETLKSLIIALKEQK